MNQFAHARAFPDHTMRDVVRPNADTLSASAILASILAGRGLSALTIIWVIVGGRGTLIGPILGAFGLFYLTASLGSQSLLNNNLVLGVILIAFVLGVPKGIVPTVLDWAAGRRGARAMRAQERRMRLRRSRAASREEAQ